MPNWCYNTIRIYGDSNELKVLCRNINEWVRKQYIKNSFCDGWLGNIVGNSGISSCDEHTDFDVRCRGLLNGMKLNDDKLTIYTETAWCPMLRMWRLICEKYLEKPYKILYTGEETSMGVVVTNDKNYVGKYLVDSCIPEVEYESCMSERRLKKLLQRVLHTKCRNLNRLFDKLDRSDLYLFVHRWEYASLDDFE